MDLFWVLLPDSGLHLPEFLAGELWELKSILQEDALAGESY